MELYTREGNRIRHSLLCELEENIFLAHGSLSFLLSLYFPLTRKRNTISFFSLIDLDRALLDSHMTMADRTAFFEPFELDANETFQPACLINHVSRLRKANRMSVFSEKNERISK